MEKLLTRSAKRVQRHNPALREGKTVIYNGLPYQISVIGKINREFKVKLTPVASQLGSTRWVSIFNLTEVYEVLVEDLTPQQNGLTVA